MPQVSARSSGGGRSIRGGAWAWVALVGAALIWAYWPTLRDLAKEWQNDPNYSVGMIVPFAAIYLLFLDRDKLAAIPIRPAWSGVLVILAGQAMRLYGLARIYETAERYSLIVTIAGLVLLIGGWPLLRALKYLLAFLLLMIPFPSAIHNAISNPLQDLSTSGAVATLELLGINVSQEGHVLQLNGGTPVAVAEACSGLRMLTAFIFVSAVMAYGVRRPAWQKVVLLLSSIPIAILVNLLRLVATALLYLWTSNHFAERFGHDFAGWVMMPVAVALLVGELWVLSRLETEEKP
jgi:exosortase